MKPDPNDPNKTRLTIVNEVNLKGGIPDFALKQGTKDSGFQISRIRKTIAKWKKDFPDDTPPG